MPFAEIKRLLRQSTGLEASLVGISAIDRAIRQRMAACGAPDANAYRDLVRDSADELQALTESVVVVETSFFRDPEAYATLARFIREEWPRRQSDRPLRMLSLPCSTGEEPYSMAMTALDAGLSYGGLYVDGVDISGRALVHARIGTYADASFRGGAAAARLRHFEKTPAGWHISDAVRHHVHFSSGNLLGTLPRFTTEAFDVVFCRNLLIYFDASSQKKAIGVVEHLLAPQGLLFVGSAETVAFINRGFIPERTPKAFAFRKAVAGDHANAKPAPLAGRHVAPEVAAHVPARPRRAVVSPLADPGPGPAAEALALDEVRRLADQGRLDEAARGCQAAVQRNGPSAEALHLLGVIRDAEGRAADAMKCYQQAIYLDPHHEDSLAHLALLFEATDRTSEAGRLKLRARRAAGRSAR